MKKSSLVKLITWFYGNSRNQQGLPWRVLGKKQSPFKVLVSETMLQQTTVPTIIKRFPPFIRQFPHAKTMTTAGLDRVLDAWAGLGYYRRAHHLFHTATILAEKTWRPFQQYDRLKTLPGVGDYTAKALLALAFQKQVLPIDSNNQRILGRFFADNHKPQEPHLGTSWHLPQNIVWSDVVQALMDLGALLCHPQNPQCHACPLSGECRGQEQWHDFPAKIKKPDKKTLYGMVLIGEDGQEVLLTRQQQNPSGDFSGLFQGLLGFPLELKTTPWQKGDKIFGHIVKQGLVHHGKTTPTITHDLTHRRLLLSLHYSDLSQKTIQQPDCHWVKRQDLADLPLPTIMKKVVKSLTPLAPSL